MAVVVVPPAARALETVLAALESAGITATRDAGAFYPQPAGVLVDLPTMIGRTLYGRTFEIPVLVVSGDPLNAIPSVDRLYALADDVAFALAVDNYRPSSWRGNVNAEALPAVELVRVLTVPETESEE